MGNNAGILVVDDDATILNLLQEILQGMGHDVTTASSAAQARRSISRRRPDLLIVDRGLPDIEGVDFVKEFRKQEGCEDIPVLMLTARCATHDKVQGLLSGADDYLTKPFAAPELAARVTVLLKRSRRPAPPVCEAKLPGLRVNFSSHEVSVQGRPVSLSPKEFELLSVLMEKAGHVLNRRFLMERIWGDRELSMNSKTVDVTVSRLRAALGPCGKYIVSVQNYGYRLETEL
jgi:DNA-binding response OmpR family regulator